ncbi:FecR domain-containing protein [Chitinophaga sp. 212800010-3]|uniref:FecR domain-containing protein n=1 Tax=unclassified Chitinophaga TaxID=2619133 RepID=UPI002DEDF335|nr:Anti-FecI sigma factor, FecR [Chitinophaga sp. 212800010-3]
MNSNRDYIAGILYKQLQGQYLTAEEQQALDQWLGLHPANETVFAEMKEDQMVGEYLRERMDEGSLGKAFGIFQQKITIATPVRHLSWRRWVAAAVVMVLITAGAWLLLQRNQQKSSRVPALAQVTDIQPGRQGAVLTLANGRQIVLDSIHNGLVAQQQTTAIILHQGVLQYEQKGDAGGTAVYNTMTTPRGRQFSLKLPDGTQVWLNAGSSLIYPAAFPANERVVTVAGEAYFEVAPDAAAPFRVKVRGGEEITVLGTGFNVYAYGNEPVMKTTLLQGSISITAGNGKTLLRPGQQALVDQQGALQVLQADTDKVMAWRNGLFNFQEASLEEVMNQLSRWYDIDIVYEKGIPNIMFEGKIKRDIALADLLRFLEGADVHFRMEGNHRLVVTP